MELRQYFSLLRRWAWLIILGALLAGISAYVVSRLTTPVYSASTTLLVNESKTSSPSDYTSILTSERLAKTYSEWLKKRPVLDTVISNLKLNLTVEQLAPAVNVQLVRDTQLIQVSVENTDPALAARIANELPKVFIEKNSEVQSSRTAASRQNLSEQLATLEKEIKNAQAALEVARTSTAAGAEAERVRLDSNLTVLRSSYATLLQSYEAVRVADALATTNVIVVEPADVPLRPVRPNTLLNTLLAVVVGLMLAVGVAFLIEYLDDTLKTPDDIQQTLGLTTLGTILRLPSADRPAMLITSNQPKSSFSEAFRTLRTNIQFSSVDKPVQTILITSSSPSEGKTTLASNLAVVMAQTGRRTVLVDADLRRPNVHKIFNLPNQRGLTNALVQEAPQLDGDLRVVPIEHPSTGSGQALRVLTSGPIPPNPSEILGSHRMSSLLEALKKEADFIVIDSPPTLAVTDASVLASKVDGVILVADSGSTRRGLALKAKEQLEQVGAHILGVALNKLSARSGGEYYYYYYNYYYYSDEQPSGASTDGARKRHKRRSSHADQSVGAQVGRVLARLRGKS